MKVLILDDDDDLTAALAQILTNRNLDVDVANNASDALDLIQETQYDLILLDYAMPIHDGIWFMKHAKLGNETKILLITGHVERRMIGTMFDLGACGYLIKPFDEEDLLRNLDFYLPSKVSA